MKLDVAHQMSEADLQKCIIGTKKRPGLAPTLGYLVAHFRTARIQSKDGEIHYATAVDGNGEGFVDLVLVSESRRRVVFAELKSESGSVRPMQKVWIKALSAVSDLLYAATARRWIVVAIWRPRDWISGEIERVLR